jgi:hypothetical protein
MVSAIDLLAPVIQTFSDWMGKCPGLAYALGVAVAAVTITMKAFSVYTAVASAVAEGWAVAATIGTGATRVWTAAMWLLSAASEFALGPIGWIILAVAALVAGIIWAYNNIGWFKDGVDAAFSFVGALVQNVATWVVNAWTAVAAWFGALPGVIGGFVTAVGAWFAALPGVIGGALAAAGHEVLMFLANLPYWATYWLTLLAVAIIQGARAAWNFLFVTLPPILGQAIAWLAALPGRVLMALGSLGLTIAGIAVRAWTQFKTWSMTLLAQFLTWLAGIRPGSVRSSRRCRVSSDELRRRPGRRSCGSPSRAATTRSRGFGRCPVGSWDSSRARARGSSTPDA